MPEGVEVRISAELIKPLVLNQNIVGLYPGKESRYKNTKPDGLEEFSKAISSWRIPMRVIDVACKGKFMYWTFTNDSDSGNWYMLNTFGMTGQWSRKEGDHVCFTYQFADTYDVHFNDPRHFGTVKFTNSEKDLNAKLNELGWDPFSGLSPQWLTWITSMIVKSKKPIGQLLLEQSIFAGVGNYIRAEALYDAKLSPWRIGNSLSKAEIEALCKSIIFVMDESYKHQGATLLTYKDAYGNEGRYSSCFKVYGKDKDPLGHDIKSETSSEGRTIHWCPDVQK